MAESRKPRGSHEEPQLKGAFVSVMIVGGFILLSWFGVFAIYLNRG